MGILNVTPDSFSGDGLLAAGGDPVRGRLPLPARWSRPGRSPRRRGESSRPGHRGVGEAEEIARVVPVVRALRDALPETPLSIDTTKPAVADAALAAGAHLLNDVWGIAPDAGLARVAAAHGVPLIVMHNRGEARYVNLLPEILADLQAAWSGRSPPASPGIG